MTKKIPPHVRNLEASAQAALDRALQARARLSAAREEHGLRDRPLFFTAAEVAEVEREHVAEIKSLVRGFTDPRRAQMARFALAPLSAGAQAQVDWAMTLAAANEIVGERGLKQAKAATAKAIVAAGRRRRAEEE